MNKKLVLGFMAAGTLLCLASCGSNSTITDKTQPSAPVKTETQAPSKASFVEEQKAFIQDVYTKAVLTENPDFDFFEACIADEAKEKFASEYDGGGSAPYKLRTEAQDGNGKSEVLEITPETDGWFLVSYTDMGYKGKTRIKLIPNTKGGASGWLIADFEQIFNEI